MKKIIILLILSSLFLASCSNSNATLKKQLTIYTTVFALEDFTKKIGGEYVDVQSIFPPGVDAHTYELSTKDVTNLADADAFIYVGEGMEGMVKKTVSTLKSEKVKLVATDTGIKLLDSVQDEHDDHGDKDTHVWLDPVLAIQIANNIKTALTELKPEAKQMFEKNFQSLETQLKNLDKKFQIVANEATNKEIIVSHAAYGYWEHRYGIKQIAIAGLSPANEPSQKELTHIIEEAKAHHVKYVLFEQNLTPKVADIVKDELGAKVLRIHNLEVVTDEDIAAKKDYFSIMNDNLTTLKEAMR